MKPIADEGGISHKFREEVNLRIMSYDLRNRKIV